MKVFSLKSKDIKRNVLIKLYQGEAENNGQKYSINL